MPELLRPEMRGRQDRRVAVSTTSVLEAERSVC